MLGELIATGLIGAGIIGFFALDAYYLNDTILIGNNDEEFYFKIPDEIRKNIILLYWNNLDEIRQGDEYWIEQHKDELKKIFKDSYDYDIEDKMLIEFIKRSDIRDTQDEFAQYLIEEKQNEK